MREGGQREGIKGEGGDKGRGRGERERIKREGGEKGKG